MQARVYGAGQPLPEVLQALPDALPWDCNHSPAQQSPVAVAAQLLRLPAALVPALRARLPLDRTPEREPAPYGPVPSIEAA